MIWRHLRNQQYSSLQRSKAGKLKDFTLRRQLEKILLQNLFPNIVSTVLSYLETERSLQPWFKGPNLLLQWMWEPGLIHMVLFLLACRMQVLWVMEVSMKTSEKIHWGRKVCSWKGNAWSCKSEAECSLGSSVSWTRQKWVSSGEKPHRKWAELSQGRDLEGSN